MGMFKIDPSNWKKMKKQMDKNKYNISTTELLDKLIKEDKIKIKSIKYTKYWFEIDSFKDYKVAEKFLPR